jgi:hypothetical protein
MSRLRAKHQTLWSPIATARVVNHTIVVAAGLLSCTARWDGHGWYSKSLNRHIAATHWHPFIDVHK